MMAYLILVTTLFAISYADSNPSVQYCKESTDSSIVIHREGGVQTEIFCTNSQIQENSPLQLEPQSPATPKSILFAHLISVSGNLDGKTFDQFPELNFVYVYNSSINSLSPKVANLWHLEFTNSNLPKISSSAFEGLPELKTLIFLSNPGLELEGGALKDLKKLTLLRLVNEAVPHLQRSLLEGQENLKKLILNGNGLTDIDEDTFRDLVNLEYLNLDDNPLESFKLDTFKSSNIKRLSLINTNVNENVLEPLSLLNELTELVLPTKIWISTDLSDLVKKFPKLKTIGLVEKDFECPTVVPVLHKAVAAGLKAFAVPPQNDFLLSLDRPKFC